MAYWLGYQAGGPGLDATPEQVGVVALAFAETTPGPNGDTITLDFLTRRHSAADIRAGAKVLQARGVKVVMSINGNPDWPGHPGGWGNLNPEVFAANVKAIVIDEWGLDGIDLDDDDGSVTPGQNFVDVISMLRKAIGPDALLTLPVYLGPKRDAFLARAKADISFVSTMAYWHDFDDQVELFNQYADLVGPEKVAIGVADVGSSRKKTPVPAVPRLAAWNPNGARKAGMMLWNLNEPPPDETAEWCAAIGDHLRR
jgi:chitinase